MSFRFSNILPRLFSTSAKRRGAPVRKSPQRRPRLGLGLESLEERTVLSHTVGWSYDISGNQLTLSASDLDATRSETEVHLQLNKVSISGYASNAPTVPMVKSGASASVTMTFALAVDAVCGTITIQKFVDKSPGTHNNFSFNPANAVIEIGDCGTDEGPSDPVATTVQLVSSDDSSTYGESVFFTATVTAEDNSTPTGTVQFYINGEAFGDAVAVDANGVAQSDSTSNLIAGTHTISAVFTPADDSYIGDDHEIIQTVSAKSLDSFVSASTQSALNVAKAGTIMVAITGAENGLVNNDELVDVFHGASFNLTLNDVEYGNITAVAEVIDNVIYVGFRMSLALQNALMALIGNTNTSAKTAADLEFGVTGMSIGDNYSLSAEALTRLFRSGKLTF